MKKLLFLSGSASSPFVQNEIRILRDFFDDICLVSYPMDGEQFQRILSDNGIRGYLIPRWQFSLRYIRDYMKWFSLKHVRNEIVKNAALSIKGIKRFCYLLYYGLYAVGSYQILEKEIINETKDCDTYVYAYWMSRPAYTAALLQLNCKEKITKVISRAHGYDLYEERSSLDYLPFRQFICAHMDEIHFISDNGKIYFCNKICTKYHIKQTPILTVSHLGTYNVHNLKKTVGDKSEIVIASCSNVSQVKRLDLIIELLSKMGGIHLRWIHIGDGELLDEIRVLVKNKIPHIDTHFYGRVENKDILPVYGKEDVDFFINMSDSEGLPVSIMEAMSVGIPVIARNVGGMSEIVNNENGCLLSEAGVDEKERVRQFIMMRVENVSLYRKFSESAVKTWCGKYNAETNYREFCKEIIRGL